MIHNIEAATLEEIRKELGTLFNPINNGLEGVLGEEDFFRKSTGYIYDLHSRYQILKYTEDERIKKEQEQYEMDSRKILKSLNVLEIQPFYDVLKQRLKPFITQDALSKIIDEYKTGLMADKTNNLDSYKKRGLTITTVMDLLEGKNIKRYDKNITVELSKEDKDELVKTANLLTLFVSKKEDLRSKIDNSVDVLYAIILYKSGFSAKKR